MTREKWEEITAMVNAKFKVLKHESRQEDREGGAEIEEIVFEGPLGTMKLEYILRPIVLDKKVIYSNRIGSDTKVEHIYSPDEKSASMKAFKWDDNQESWLEISAESFSA